MRFCLDWLRPPQTPARVEAILRRSARRHTRLGDRPRAAVVFLPRYSLYGELLEAIEANRAPPTRRRPWPTVRAADVLLETVYRLTVSLAMCRGARSRSWPTRAKVLFDTGVIRIHEARPGTAGSSSKIRFTTPPRPGERRSRSACERAGGPGAGRSRRPGSGGTRNRLGLAPRRSLRLPAGVQYDPDTSSHAIFNAGFGGAAHVGSGSAEVRACSASASTTMAEFTPRR